MKKFYCGFCDDKIARTRRGLRDHIRGNHLRNEYFNRGIGVKRERRAQIIEEKI